MAVVDISEILLGPYFLFKSQSLDLVSLIVGFIHFFFGFGIML